MKFTYDKGPLFVTGWRVTDTGDCGDFALSKLDEFDAKSRLQEKTMALYKALPEYRATELSDGSYKVELFLCSLFIASVEAPSKKKGEMKVAARALKENLYVLKE
jgi:ribonuclease-3